jgi:pyruvate-formate lyase-activating enzyme
MQVNFGGFVPLSTVDWFGYSVATVFFRGCALKCKDCQNKSIVEGEDYRDTEEIKKMILESKPLISGVVFSGGEPLEQVKPLLALIIWCKTQRLKTFIHTSGNQPINLNLIMSHIDGVRLDAKPMEQFSGRTLYSEKWSRYVSRYVRSELAIKKSGLDYWISAVALRNSNYTLESKDNVGVDIDGKHLIIVQGNEKNPFTADELAEKFQGCYIHTRQGGLQWIPERSRDIV